MQFSVINNGKKSPIKPLILNNIWFIYIKAYINDAIRAKFVERYIADNKYTKIIKNLKAITSKNTGFFLKLGLLFVLINKLLYNIRADRIYSLYILYGQIKAIFEAAYNKKFYFGCNYMLYNLKSLAIYKKISEIKQYIKYYLKYQIN